MRTERERVRQLFADRPKARILVEASTISEWVARLLEELGHEVVVADPNYAPMYAQRSRRRPGSGSTNFPSSGLLA
jgi:transposase